MAIPNEDEITSTFRDLIDALDEFCDALVVFIEDVQKTRDALAPKPCEPGCDCDRPVGRPLVEILATSPHDDDGRPEATADEIFDRR